MNKDWKTFLNENGANLDGDNVTDFGDPAGELAIALSADTMMDLSTFALLEISGKDADTFLQGQFTTDIDRIKEGDVTHGAWCNTKGRVHSNFLLIRLGTKRYLMLPAELKQPFVQRLKMYILRADVAIEDLEQNCILLGLQGDAISERLQAIFKSLPDAPYRATQQDGTLLFSLPDNHARYVIATAVETAKTLWLKLTGETRPAGTQLWRLYDILAGLPWVNSDTSEQFLPQSLNLDELGGLSFNKGCYLGQEIIARMHFRGQLKQRMYSAAIETDLYPAPGTRLYMRGAAQTIGAVVNAARHPDGKWRLLVIADTGQIRDNHVLLGDTNGPVLHFITS